MTVVGEVFLDLIEQDVAWRTGDGRVLALDAMESAHCASVLRMLERMAGGLYAEWVDEFLVDAVVCEQLAALGIGERDCVTEEYDFEEVSGWFERQPLVRRLRALLAASTGTRRPSWRA